jgi:hypothetical protein
MQPLLGKPRLPLERFNVSRGFLHPTLGCKVLGAGETFLCDCC